MDIFPIDKHTVSANIEDPGRRTLGARKISLVNQTPPTFRTGIVSFLIGMVPAIEAIKVVSVFEIDSGHVLELGGRSNAIGIGFDAWRGDDAEGRGWTQRAAWPWSRSAVARLVGVTMYSVFFQLPSQWALIECGRTR